MSVDFMAQWDIAGSERPGFGVSINLANGNAAELLELLGYDTSEELYGEATPDDFEGRVVMAQALLDVATDDEHGRPEIVDREPGRATFITSARLAGYLAMRLAQLEDVIKDARAHEGLVVWT